MRRGETQDGAAYEKGLQRRGASPHGKSVKDDICRMGEELHEGVCRDPGEKHYPPLSDGGPLGPARKPINGCSNFGVAWRREQDQNPPGIALENSGGRRKECWADLVGGLCRDVGVGAVWDAEVSLGQRGLEVSNRGHGVHVWMVAGQQDEPLRVVTLGFSRLTHEVGYMVVDGWDAGSDTVAMRAKLNRGLGARTRAGR